MTLPGSTSSWTISWDSAISGSHRRFVHRPTWGHAVRRMAYRSRMEQAGYEPQVVYSQTSEQSAFEAAQKLLKEAIRRPPSSPATICSRLCVLRAIAELGLDAEDVSVVGYDINLAGHPLISLTTVDQFGFEVE